MIRRSIVPKEADSFSEAAPVWPGVALWASLLLGAWVPFQLGCRPEAPVAFENANLGVRVLFPGQPTGARMSEPTPFGLVDWYLYLWQPMGRLDTDFHVAVGNLPEGKEGGSTPSEVLATYQAWLKQRLGALAFTELPPEQGPGFRYHVVGPQGTHIAGVLILRRGRLHRAQATVPRADDPRLKTFLESFWVQ